MTTQAEGHLLTRVGPGTPMGKFMREYWIPAVLSSELTANSPPRGASLFFGRNDKDGLRCAYHGWKFDVAGNCLDMPNVPKHQAFPHRVGAKAYPTAERFGLIWTYMGERMEPPPLPLFESVMVADDSERNLFMVQRECSYLQALEGDIDTSHLGFLHMGGVEAEDTEPGHLGRYALSNRAPEYHVADTDWGTMYSAYRPGAPGETYWRFAHFMFPFWTIPPDGAFREHVVARAWVPMDDNHTMFVHAAWKKNAPVPAWARCCRTCICRTTPAGSGAGG
jgi:phthalate 4,5-dioxygenase oxygenase subunit